MESSTYNYFPHRASRVGPRFQAYVAPFDATVKLNEEEVKRINKNLLIYNIYRNDISV